MKGFAVVKPPLPSGLADQLEQADAEARHRFAADVDQILGEIHAYVERLPADTFERVSRHEAWCDVHRVVLEKFAQPVRSLEVTLLRQEVALLTQLLELARSVLQHPDESSVDPEALVTRITQALGN